MNKLMSAFEQKRHHQEIEKPIDKHPNHDPHGSRSLKANLNGLERKLIVLLNEHKNPETEVTA